MIDLPFIVIFLGCFVAGVVNAAFATGGVYIMLLASSSVLPLSQAIPLQPVFAVGSLAGRIFYFWRYINWRIFNTFVLGSLVGVFLGTQAFANSADRTLSILLGTVLLALIWVPRTNWKVPLQHPFFFVGILHSFLGALLGVGGILQPLVIRTTLLKYEITATLAACMLTLDVFKAVGYVSIGFDYLNYLPHIVGATVAGILGTWVGKQMSHRVSEESFRRIFRLIVSIAAVRFIASGVLG